MYVSELSPTFESEFNELTLLAEIDSAVSEHKKVVIKKVIQFNLHYLLWECLNEWGQIGF